MKKHLILFCCLFGLMLASCRHATLFEQVNSAHSGIHFRNDITENDSMNVMDVSNIYNGGGVGIGDFNNDGLPDIYFTGNAVSNKLYLNKGDLRFSDITAAAGVEGEGKWSRGVSVVDINNDGWQDIYISATLSGDFGRRENILYINQGLNREGIPYFRNMAKEYGLNDRSYTTQAVFFDYDNDGDLDVYLAVNQILKADYPNSYRPVFKNGEHPSTGKLLRNDWDSVKGHPVFTDVSRQAGITIEGYTHSTTVCDINQDGWKDIYVTNDYLSNNVLYINNGNGTFTDRSKEYFRHTAYNAMGADVVDINNDGLSDVVELDMNPEDNYRKKTMLGVGNYQNYLNNDYFGYQYQYVRNCLQLNMGNSLGANDSLRHPVFSEIGFYAGIAQTDWSWAPLVADFDNDGFRDIIVTNGFPKDVTDHDFVAYRNTAFALNSKEKLLSQMPVVKIPNYAFRNTGDLRFRDVTTEWGLGTPSFSNGAAYADLDNDGDLDIIINNINDEAMVFENKSNEQKNKAHHYLQVKLEGNSPNRDAFGSWVKIYYDHGHKQVYETNPVRGYLSTNQNLLNFGLGQSSIIDSLVVIWPDNKKQKQINIAADQVILLKQSQATEIWSWALPLTNKDSWFSEISSTLKLNYTQQQKDFNDFSIQTLLPHKLSQYTPCMAVGDINNDGLEDLVIGGTSGKSAVLFYQTANGSFERRPLTDSAHAALQQCDDTGILLFDADGDHDLDMYLCHGGYEQRPGSAGYQDGLYLNDGKGNFTRDDHALPVNYGSKSCVKAIDFDNDGDLDLFIGERVEPWQYPKPGSCILLRNDTKNGVVKFTDVTKTVAPELQKIGLVCDALVTDYNNDGWPDLIIAGEWMPITFLKNKHGILVNETGSSGIGNTHGWWNSLAGADIDQDGKMDFIAGNLGENSFFSGSDSFPVHAYFNDFDGNGTYENIITKFIKDQKGVYREYPAHGRDEVIEQLPVIKKRFMDYKSFAKATIHDLFTSEKIAGALKLYANYAASSYIKNMGGGRFELRPLPALAQLSPVFGIISDDFDGDGNTDILICGNDYGAEVFNGRLDASNGLVLKGDGKGNFTPLSIQQSGVYIPGDARRLVKLKSATGGYIYIAAIHNGALKAFALKRKLPLVQ